jgi:hypothetical protein
VIDLADGTQHHRVVLHRPVDPQQIGGIGVHVTEDF